MPSFMEPLGSRSCARSWQLKERHILHLHPPPLQQRLPDGLESGWVFQARPVGQPHALSWGRERELDLVAQPWGKAACLSPLQLEAWNMLVSALEPLFYFLI